MENSISTFTPLIYQTSFSKIKKRSDIISPYLLNRRRIITNSDLQVVAFVLARFSMSASKENPLNKTDKKGEAAKETTEIEVDYFHYY